MKRFSLKNKNQKKILSKEEAIASLQKFYQKLPETSGCMENIHKEGGCSGWCCRFQSPQVLQIEFLNTWFYVMRNFSDDEVVDVVERAFRTYLNNDFSKGCIFWNSETKLCRIHDARPFNCFLYGITPDEEFNERYEKMKKEHEGEFGAVIKRQCNLVSTVNRDKPTLVEANTWWSELLDIEKSIGISESNIHDDSGGSYRTYHDYILMRFLPDEILSQMTILRIHGQIEEKEQFVCNAMKYFKNKIQSLMGKANNERA